MNIIIILLDVHSMSIQGFNHFILYSSWQNKAISISSLKTCNYHWLNLQCVSSEREGTINIYIYLYMNYRIFKTIHVLKAVGPFPYFSSD